MNTFKLKKGCGEKISHSSNLFPKEMVEMLESHFKRSSPSFVAFVIWIHSYDQVDELFSLMPTKHGFGRNITVNTKAEISKATWTEYFKATFPQGKILSGRQQDF